MSVARGGAGDATDSALGAGGKPDARTGERPGRAREGTRPTRTPQPGMVGAERGPGQAGGERGVPSAIHRECVDKGSNASVVLRLLGDATLRPSQPAFIIGWNVAIANG